jgi:hypothetical protein
MAWIKYRTNLPTDPRVVRIASTLRKPVLHVTGALLAFWAVGDEHTTDGVLHGYTAEAVDELVGIRGFSDALRAVNWIEVGEGFVAIPDFNRHNGESAKKRAIKARNMQKYRGPNVVLEGPQNDHTSTTKKPQQGHLEVEVRGESKRKTSLGVALSLNGSSRFPNENPDTTPGIHAASPVTLHPHLEGARLACVKFLFESLTFGSGDVLHRKQRQRLMARPGCTPERVWWLCERIRAGEGKANPATWLEAGIDQQWALDGADESAFRAWWDKTYGAMTRIETRRAGKTAGGAA